MTNDSYNDPTFTSTHGHNDRVGLSTVVSPRLAAGRRPAAGGMPPWPWPAAYIHIAISNSNAWQCGVMVSVDNLATAMEWKSYL
jgi:hypothetical protein